jgi:hypothetical protein
MDVTPTPGLLRVMEHLTQEFIGEEPLAVETSTAAQNRRAARRMMMDILHNIVRLSMRIGVARYLMAHGKPVVEDNIKPDPVGKAVRDSAPTSGTLQIVR